MSRKINILLPMICLASLSNNFAMGFMMSTQQRSGFVLNNRRTTEASTLLLMLLATSDDIVSGIEGGSRRRFFLQSAAAVTTTLASIGMDGRTNPAHAAASQVRAPIDLLRPATRIRLYIDEAIVICRSIIDSNDDKNPTLSSSSSSSSLQTLQNHFDQEPTTFMTPDEEKLSQRYLEIRTAKSWQRARLREREARGAELGVDYTTPYDKFNTAIQQWGDDTQFQILRSRQKGLEKSNPYRKAFNAYTNNLVFGDGYQLNVNGDEKKALVRNDALPDVNAVVVSDLDLRDLYRNQVLQNMDDAKAELTYQLKVLTTNNADEVDAAEILTCLLAARESCNKWFSFIPKDDVDEALRLVKGEKEEETR